MDNLRMSLISKTNIDRGFFMVSDISDLTHTVSSVLLLLSVLMLVV